MTTALQPTESPIATTFKAEWPKELDPALKSTCAKIRRIFWNVISVIIFPIGLVRLAFWWVRDIVMRIAVMPGSPTSSFAREHIFKTFGGKEITLTSPDGTELDAVFIPGKDRKKAIVFACGNGQQWDSSEYFFQILKHLGVSIICVNPPGIGKSKGRRSERDAALGVYTGYEYLIKKEGIDPNDIALVGFSLGAGYGAIGASMIQKKYPDKKINAININSFSTLKKEVQGVLSKVGCVCCCLPLGSILRLGARLLSFDMNAKAAFDTLKGEKCVIYNPEDDVIPESASMYRAVENNPKGKITTIELSPKYITLDSSHCRSFLPDEQHKLYDQLLDMLNIDIKNTSIQKLKFTKENMEKWLLKYYSNKLERLSKAEFPDEKSFEIHLHSVMRGNSFPSDPSINVSVIGN